MSGVPNDARATGVHLTVPQVKFCGLTCEEDACAANAVRPDFAGLVLWPKSKRAVTADEARRLRQKLDSDIACVGVFVDEDAAAVAGLFAEGTIQVAQLHGSEDEAYLARLRELAPGLRVWKAFVVRWPEDVAAAQASSADLPLVDGGLGGGRPFDWSLLAGLNRPFGLAGGLSCENVGEALRRVHPALVDVSSGIERPERGPDGRPRKDLALMRAFMAEVRRGAQRRRDEGGAPAGFDTPIYK